MSVLDSRELKSFVKAISNCMFVHIDSSETVSAILFNLAYRYLSGIKLQIMCVNNTKTFEYQLLKKENSDLMKIDSKCFD